MPDAYDPPYEAIGLAITGFNDVEFMLHLSLANWRYIDGGILDLSATSELPLAALLKDFRKHLEGPLSQIRRSQMRLRLRATSATASPTLGSHLTAL